MSISIITQDFDSNKYWGLVGPDGLNMLSPADPALCEQALRAQSTGSNRMAFVADKAEYLAYILVFDNGDPQSREVSFGTKPGQRRRGYAFRLLNWAMETFVVNEASPTLVAKAASENQASNALLRKVGFRSSPSLSPSLFSGKNDKPYNYYELSHRTAFGSRGQDSLLGARQNG